jgi:hypothetical protein
VFVLIDRLAAMREESLPIILGFLIFLRAILDKEIVNEGFDLLYYYSI